MRWVSLKYISQVQFIKWMQGGQFEKVALSQKNPDISLAKTPIIHQKVNILKALLYLSENKKFNQTII